MKTTMRSIMLFALMAAGAPAFADTSVTEILMCKQLQSASEADLEEAALGVAKAVRSMKGGEDIGVHLQFPLVAHMGEYDFFLVFSLPSASLWGDFMDDHADSDVMVDAEENFFKLADCPDSGIFETVDIK
jgi:hypothetical protein